MSSRVLQRARDPQIQQRDNTFQTASKTNTFPRLPFPLSFSQVSVPTWDVSPSVKPEITEDGTVLVMDPIMTFQVELERDLLLLIWKFRNTISMMMKENSLLVKFPSRWL